jgi:hypothetical protein
VTFLKIAELVKVALLAIACLSAVSIQRKQSEGSASPAIPQIEDAWNFPDFSGTQVIQTKAYDMPMKIYRSGYVVRVQKTEALGTLYLPANGKVYELTQYPDNSRQCVVMRTAQARGLPSPLELLFGTKVVKTGAGTDVIEGHNCKVENVTVTRPDGEKIEAKVWGADDLKGIPVKIVARFLFGYPRRVRTRRRQESRITAGPAR